MIRLFIVMLSLVFGGVLSASTQGEVWKPKPGQELVYKTVEAFNFERYLDGSFGFEKSEAKGDRFVESFRVSRDLRSIRRTSVRRLDQDLVNEDSTDYAVINASPLTAAESDSLFRQVLSKLGNTSKKSGETIAEGEWVWMITGQPGTGNIETMWLAKDWKVSVRSSGMFQMWFFAFSRRIDRENED